MHLKSNAVEFVKSNMQIELRVQIRGLNLEMKDT